MPDQRPYKACVCDASPKLNYLKLPADRVSFLETFLRRTSGEEIIFVYGALTTT
jgi:hypothetical protein